MAEATVILILIVALIVAFNMIWPPAWAPERWRRWTRPIRRRLRPRRYR